MKLSTYMVLFFSVLAFSTPQSFGAKVVAEVNKTKLTLEYLNKKFQESRQFFSFQTPTKKRVLEELINREVGVQEAKRSGLHNDPDVIDRMNTVLYQALIEKKLGKKFEKIHVSDSEASNYYKRNPEIRTSHIFVRVPPDAKKADEIAAKKRIQQVLAQQVRPKKKSFSEIARQFSEGAAASLGGDIGYQTKATLDPAYYKAAMRLKTPGRVSGIIRSQFGFHIIRLSAIRPWSETDKAKVKRLVFEERRKKIFDGYIAKLRRKSKIKINSKLIK